MFKQIQNTVLDAWLIRSLKSKTTSEKLISDLYYK